MGRLVYTLEKIVLHKLLQLCILLHEPRSRLWYSAGKDAEQCTRNHDTCFDAAERQNRDHTFTK